jgi:molybdopterin molybdotransferase
MLDAAHTPSRLAHFLRVVAGSGADGMLEARLAGAQGSNLLSVMATANALLHVPEAVERVHEGDVLEVIPLSSALWQPVGGR